MNVFGERAAFGAVGRQDDYFAIAALHIGCEDGGHAAAGNGLAEDDMAISKINADVFADEAEIANAVAFVPVEAAGSNGGSEIRGGTARERQVDEKCERCQAHHSYSVVPAGKALAPMLCGPIVSQKPAWRRYRSGRRSE